jgi:hypothetical protein
MKYGILIFGFIFYLQPSYSQDCAPEVDQTESSLASIMDVANFFSPNKLQISPSAFLLISPAPECRPCLNNVNDSNCNKITCSELVKHLRLNNNQFIKNQNSPHSSMALGLTDQIVQGMTPKYNFEFETSGKKIKFNSIMLYGLATHGPHQSRRSIIDQSSENPGKSSILIQVSGETDVNKAPVLFGPQNGQAVSNGQTGGTPTQNNANPPSSIFITVSGETDVNKPPVVIGPQNGQTGSNGQTGGTPTQNNANPPASIFITVSGETNVNAPPVIFHNNGQTGSNGQTGGTPTQNNANPPVSSMFLTVSGTSISGPAYQIGGSIPKEHPEKILNTPPAGYVLMNDKLVELSQVPKSIRIPTHLVQIAPGVSAQKEFGPAIPIKSEGGLQFSFVGNVNVGTQIRKFNIITFTPNPNDPTKIDVIETNHNQVNPFIGVFQGVSGSLRNKEGEENLILDAGIKASHSGLKSYQVQPQIRLSVPIDNKGKK